MSLGLGARTVRLGRSPSAVESRRRDAGGCATGGGAAFTSATGAGGLVAGPVDCRRFADSLGMTRASRMGLGFGSGLGLVGSSTGKRRASSQVALTALNADKVTS